MDCPNCGKPVEQVSDQWELYKKNLDNEKVVNAVIKALESLGYTIEKPV